MYTASLLVAASLLGVDYEVKIENDEPIYVVSIEQAVVEQLTDGFVINSSIPAEHQNVRRIRILIKRDDGSNLPEGEDDSIQLEPDASIVPFRPEEPVVETVNLEPMAVKLPDFSDESTEQASVATDDGDVLVPQFDSDDNEGTSVDLDLPFLDNSNPVVRIEEDVPDTFDQINTADSEPDSVATPSAEAAGVGGEQTVVTDPSEPDLIDAHRDQFVALATAEKIPTADSSEELSAAEEDAQGPASLLLLMFSVTLNIFLAVTLFRHYRQ